MVTIFITNVLQLSDFLKKTFKLLANWLFSLDFSQPGDPDPDTGQSPYLGGGFKYFLFSPLPGK